MECPFCLRTDGLFAFADDASIKSMLVILDQKILFNHPECKVLKQNFELKIAKLEPGQQLGYHAACRKDMARNKDRDKRQPATVGRPPKPSPAAAAAPDGEGR